MYIRFSPDYRWNNTGKDCPRFKWWKFIKEGFVAVPLLGTVWFGEGNGDGKIGRRIL